MYFNDFKTLSKYLTEHKIDEFLTLNFIYNYLNVNNN